TATARILPPQEAKGGLGAGLLGTLGDLSALAGFSGGASPGDLYVGMLQSRTVADAIIDRFDLMRVYGKEYRVQMYDTFAKLADISLGKKDGIITISVDDEDPERAAAIANAYVEELKKLNIQLNLSNAGRERLFLEERLTVAKAELARAEENLQRFQEQNKAIRIDAQASAIIDAISKLRGELASKEVDLGVLLSYQTEQSPQVKAVREAIAQLSDQIRKLEQSPTDGKVSDDIFLVTAAVPELGVQYARHLREFQVQEAIYEMLTKQFEAAKINEARNTSTIQVLDDAAVPDKKSKPRRSLIVLVTTFVVFLLSVLSTFVLEGLRSLTGEDRDRLDAIKAQLRLRRRTP
ncbi:MAG: lipopolysaccharide biosynthesis protein, partial [Proteobacteria bacterium]|nr:lipopolysaccharide biosynthesis protein [Pseudomonadota bacterium]